MEETTSTGHQLGESLRALRSNAGFSLAALAKKLGVTKGYLSKLECGRSSPSRTMLNKMSGIFQADLARLLILAGHVPEDITDVVYESGDRSIKILREQAPEYMTEETQSKSVCDMTKKRPPLYHIEKTDCFDWLKARMPNSIHAVVTDPPYGLKEYKREEQEKLHARSGGVWRMPPRLNGCERMPLPRFTVLSNDEKDELLEFFRKWGTLLYPVLVPGAHIFVATNPLVSHLVFLALIQAGFEKRGEVIRLVQTLRGGDRPKNAHTEYSMVTVMPRSCWEPWGLFRKPCEGRVQDNLRKWKTGGLRRISPEQPFCDLIKSSPTRGKERSIACHPSLKPQAFMRELVRAALPLGEGIVLDTFMGGGSTIAAAQAVGYESIGLEIDERYFRMAKAAIPQLASLHIGGNGLEEHRIKPPLQGKLFVS
jgi:site-specific DNA-methyltransferase (adenine-specific)